MNNLSLNERMPSVHITKNRQRVKQFDKKIYLNNNDEFEIELFNPTSFKITAGITVNDESIGNELILRPGERVFLERFTNDNNRKFIFKTYEINGNDPEAVKAIESNGYVRVNFYKERIPFQQPKKLFRSVNIEKFDAPIIPTADPNFKYTYELNTTCFDNPFIGFCCDTTSYSTKATGRIEHGSVSTQNFEIDTTSEFEYFSFHSDCWQIFPKESQPILANDIVLYCGKCGFKRRKTTFKFCPHCGNKF
jgi:hypothetical protein